MSDRVIEIKREIIRMGSLMEKVGFASGLEGNLSIIDRETGLIYITPSGFRKGSLTEDMIAVMDGDTQVDGKYKRSSEYYLHKKALETRTDCDSALHLHPAYLTAFSLCGEPIRLRCATTFALVAGDEIPCVPYGQPGTEHIADGVEEALAEHDVALLENHGIICVDKNLDHACAVVEALEDIMRTYAIAKQLGLNPKDIPDEEYALISGVAKITGK